MLFACPVSSVSVLLFLSTVPRGPQHVPPSGGVWMSVIQQLCSSSLSGVDSGLSRGVLRASSQLPTVSLALVGAAVYLMSSYVAVAGGSGYWISPCPSGTRSWLAHPGSGRSFKEPWLVPSGDLHAVSHIIVSRCHGSAWGKCVSSLLADVYVTHTLYLVDSCHLFHLEVQVRSSAQLDCSLFLPSPLQQGDCIYSFHQFPSM